MTGLTGTPAAQASLLLNAEAVLTALIARFMVKENFDRRTAIGLEHSHPHEHDEHHRHLHGGGVSAAASHTHWHRHESLEHAHPHYPDLNHRHPH